MNHLSFKPLNQKLPLWVEKIYGSDAGRQASLLPVEILKSLYPELTTYGPNFQRFLTLHAAARKQLADSSALMLTHLPPWVQTTPRKQLLHFLNGAPVCSVEEVYVPTDYQQFITAAKDFIRPTIHLQPDMNKETGAGMVYEDLLLSVVLDGIFEDEPYTYIAGPLKENMDVVKRMEFLLRGFY